MPLRFLSGDFVSLRGKKYLMAVDPIGYAYYFFTRDNKKFFFSGRVWIGGAYSSDGQSVESRISQLQDESVLANAKAAIDPTVKKIVNFGTYGYFTVFQSYFAYSRHLEPFSLDSHICVPGMNLFKGDINNGIKDLVADVAISGLVYVLPESGDQISLFMIEIQSGAQPGARKRGGKGGKTA